MSLKVVGIIPFEVFGFPWRNVRWCWLHSSFFPFSFWGLIYFLVVDFRRLHLKYSVVGYMIKTYGHLTTLSVGSWSLCVCPPPSLSKITKSHDFICTFDRIKSPCSKINENFKMRLNKSLLRKIINFISNLWLYFVAYTVITFWLSFAQM